MNALVPNPAIAYAPVSAIDGGMSDEDQPTHAAAHFGLGVVVSGAAAAADFDINRGSGKLTVTIADRMGAYVIFGQCKAAGATAQ